MKHVALPAVVLVLFAGYAPVRAASTPQNPANNPSGASQHAPPAARAALTPLQSEMIRGQELMGAKEYDQAVSAFVKLTSEYPENYTAWDLLGVALQQTGKIDAARAAYVHATKLNKKYAEAYNNIGTTWYQEERYGRAISAYKKALAAQPEMATAYGNLAYAYFSVKKYPEAVAALNKALSIDPNVFVLSGYAGTALQDRSVSDHGTFYFLMAKSYAERGDSADCAEYLRKSFDEGYKNVAAVKTDPSFAKVLADPKVQEIVDKAEANAAGKPPVAPGT